MTEISDVLNEQSRGGSRENESEGECWNILQGLRNAEEPGGLVAKHSSVQSQHRAAANKSLPVLCVHFEFKCFQRAVTPPGGNKLLS